MIKYSLNKSHKVFFYFKSKVTENSDYPIPGLVGVNAKRIIETGHLLEENTDSHESIKIENIDCLDEKKGEIEKLRSIIQENIYLYDSIILESSISPDSFSVSNGSDLINNDAYLMVPKIEWDGDLDYFNLLSSKIKKSERKVRHFESLFDMLSKNLVLKMIDYFWVKKFSSVALVGNGIFTEYEKSILRSSFLISQYNEELAWTIEPSIAEFKEALSNYQAKQVDFTQHDIDSFGKLWSIERTIRLIILDDLANKFRQTGDWRIKIFDSFDDPGKKINDVVTRAKQSYEVPVELGDIPNPLDWLEFSDLFEVRNKFNIQGGLSGREWTYFNEKLRPIRNKLAHMRILSESDVLLIDQYYKIAQNALRNLG